jgi:hypothetical protein
MLNHGDRADRITRDSSFIRKLGENARRMHRCIFVQKISRPTFLKLCSNAMKSRDQSLNHLFIHLQFAICFFLAQIRDK